MIPITDTHQHLVYPERWPYDWAVGYLPRDGEGFRLADYRQAIAGTGITRSVFMETGLEPPHDAAETDFALDLVRDDPLVAGVIAGRGQGMDLADCARLATAFAAGAITRLGARLPPREELDALFQQVAVRRCGRAV